MKLRHLRNIDLLYAIIWVVVALLYLLDIVRGRISGQVAPELDLRVLGHIFLTLIPFFLLFPLQQLSSPAAPATTRTHGAICWVYSPGWPS